MRIVIVDPDRRTQNQVINQIKNKFESNDLHVFENPIDAWKDIVINDVDYLFTKIEMPRYSGYELATMAKKKKRSIEINFISADGKDFIGETE